MRRHVIIGAGPIGRGIATLLVANGDRVVLASRSGVTGAPDGSTGAQVDATDAEALSRLAEGADTLVNAVNPASYATWQRDWPPVAAALLSAAEKTGAGLLTISNLYGYGPVDGLLTEDLPLNAPGTKGRIRAQMWRDALAAHRAGRIRATELRPSDYFGAGVSRHTSMLNEYVIAPTAAGKRVRLVAGHPDVLHSWSYLPDIAALGAALATDDRAWGRAWHVPTNEPRTPQQVVDDVAALTGRPATKVTRIPGALMWLARVVPTVRELDETAYQFNQPFVLDSSAAQRTFDLAPTPWHNALEATVRNVG